MLDTEKACLTSFKNGYLKVLEMIKHHLLTNVFNFFAIFKDLSKLSYKENAKKSENELKTSFRIQIDTSFWVWNLTMHSEVHFWSIVTTTLVLLWFVFFLLWFFFFAVGFVLTLVVVVNLVFLDCLLCCCRRGCCCLFSHCRCRPELHTGLY